MQYHFQLETQIARCLPGDDGGMNVQAATQWIDGTSEIVSKVLNVPESRYRWSSVPPTYAIFVVKHMTIRPEFSLCLSFCLLLSLFHSLSPSFSFSLSRSFCLSLSHFVFLSVSVCPHFLSLSVLFSLFLSVCLSLLLSSQCVDV